LQVEHAFDWAASMGYRGKVAEQEQARRLRAEGHTMLEIANHLGVSKSSASLWTSDVDFMPRAPLRQYQSGKRSEHPFHVAKIRQIQELDADGLARLGVLDEQAFLAAGAALYAGEGSKSEGEVRFANTDPRIVRFFCEWLRHFFDIDEGRLRVRLYLHQGLDLEAAVVLGEDHRLSPPSGSGRRTGRSQMRASARRSTCTGVRL
jgi:transcriptional regulator with XRE-family HTH domain